METVPGCYSEHPAAEAVITLRMLGCLDVVKPRGIQTSLSLKERKFTFGLGKLNSVPHKSDQIILFQISPPF